MTISQNTYMRILFLTESREDYLADSILHGLISLGHEVTDYPRKQILYRPAESCSANTASSIRGHGFTLYGNLDGRSVDRTFVVQRLEKKYFDLVVFGQIWRQWGQILDLAPLLQHVPVVLLDGDDDTRIFYRSGTRIRRYGWQPFPFPSSRSFYFKRELQSALVSLSPCHVLPVSFSIPAEKIRPIDLARKTKRFASHCVDPEVAAAFGLHTSYAFSSEDAYYDDLATSRFAVTTKRGGWDCLRHYEIAAAGSLLCFRQLETKPDSCAPHGLHSGLNCISYQSLPDLQKQLDILNHNPLLYQSLLQASGDWVRQYTTNSVAQRLLDSVFAS